MAKQKKWMPAVLELLIDTGLKSVAIEQKLKNRFRYAPTAREITFALNTDRRFAVVCDDFTSSLGRKRSHKVKVWGLQGVNYYTEYPYRRM